MQRTCWIIVLALAAATSLAAGRGESAAGNGKAIEADGRAWSGFMWTPDPDASPAEQRQFATLTEALSQQSMAEAEITAKQLVETANLDPLDSRGRARALNNLAVTQSVLGDYESSLQNYMAAVDAVATGNNNLSPDMILPLRGMAATFIRMERPQEAFQVLERALHVSQVNFGPHGLEQQPMLDQKLEFFLDQDQTESALQVLDRIYMIHEREYGRHSMALLPALYHRADVYGDLGLYREEREAWRDILRIKEKHLPANDLQLIEPNVHLAYNLARYMTSDTFRSVSSSVAERHLKHALWIAENSPDGTWRVRKECLLSLADFYTLFDMKGRARKYYGFAWELLSSSEESLPDREKSFGMPVPIARPAPDRYANFEYRPGEDDDEEAYEEGEITVRFTVNDRGRTDDLEVISADPEGFGEIETRIGKAVDNFVYRPRYDNGKPAETVDQQYSFRYYYRPSEYRASLEKAGESRRFH